MKALNEDKAAGKMSGKARSRKGQKPIARLRNSARAANIVEVNFLPDYGADAAFARRPRPAPAAAVYALWSVAGLAIMASLVLFGLVVAVATVNFFA